MSIQAQPWRTGEDLPGQRLSSAPDAAAVTAPLKAAPQCGGKTHPHPQAALGAGKAEGARHTSSPAIPQRDQPDTKTSRGIGKFPRG